MHPHPVLYRDPRPAQCRALHPDRYTFRRRDPCIIHRQVQYTGLPRGQYTLPHPGRCIGPHPGRYIVRRQAPYIARPQGQCNMDRPARCSLGSRQLRQD